MGSAPSTLEDLGGQEAVFLNPTCLSAMDESGELLALQGAAAKGRGGCYKWVAVPTTALWTERYRLVFTEVSYPL